MGKRTQPRITKRLETQFGAKGHNFTGISSNVSENGIFIKTRHSFIPGTILTIDLILPDGKVCHLQGHVKRTFKSSITSLKNGMGIELILKDDSYKDFMQSLHGNTATPAEESSQNGFQLILCPDCGVQNRVPASKALMNPKCGRCGSLLSPAAT
jgi:ribosomal protein S27E